MVYFMPYKHSTSDRSTSIRAKSITASLGRILSTKSTSTSSVLAFPLDVDSSVNIYEPPVLAVLTDINPLECLLLAPTL